MGLELQLEELTEQRRRAEAQGDAGLARWLTIEIERLQLELAETAELAAAAPPSPGEPPRLHNPDELADEDRGH